MDSGRQERCRRRVAHVVQPDPRDARAFKGLAELHNHDRLMQRVPLPPNEYKIPGDAEVATARPVSGESAMPFQRMDGEWRENHQTPARPRLGGEEPPAFGGLSVKRPPDYDAPRVKVAVTPRQRRGLHRP